ncbi:MAG: hypothetical protein H0W58_08770 [Acidobacteria bacterium]|nr:hypothetical protein [Acidobacteriota bacterium]
MHWSAGILARLRARARKTFHLQGRCAGRDARAPIYLLFSFCVGISY